MTFQPSVGQLIDPTTVVAPAFTQAQITAAVAVASAQILGATGRQLGVVTDDVELVESTATGFQLKQYPVTAITQVQMLIAGSWETVDPSMYAGTPDGWVDMPLAPLNMPIELTPGTLASYPLLPNYTTQLQVTYTHGYATLPTDLVSACTHLTTLYLANPLGLVEAKVGEIADRWSPTDVGGYAPWVAAVLNRYRNVGVS